MLVELNKDDLIMLIDSYVINDIILQDHKLKNYIHTPFGEEDYTWNQEALLALNDNEIYEVFTRLRM